MATPAPSPRSLLKTTVLLRISEEKAAMEEESAGNRNLDLLCTLIKDNFKLTCTTEKAVNEGVVEVFLVVTREMKDYSKDMGPIDAIKLVINNKMNYTCYIYFEMFEEGTLTYPHDIWLFRLFRK